jgi:hypothetical protein
MDRRLFMNAALGTSVAPACWVRTGVFGARPPVVPSPACLALVPMFKVAG